MFLCVLTVLSVLVDGTGDDATWYHCWKCMSFSTSKSFSLKWHLKSFTLTAVFGHVLWVQNAFILLASSLFFFFLSYFYYEILLLLSVNILVIFILLLFFSFSSISYLKSGISALWLDFIISIYLIYPIFLKDILYYFLFYFYFPIFYFFLNFIFIKEFYNFAVLPKSLNSLRSKFKVIIKLLMFYNEKSFFFIF